MSSIDFVLRLKYYNHQECTKQNNKLSFDDIFRFAQNFMSLGRFYIGISFSKLIFETSVSATILIFSYLT